MTPFKLLTPQSLLPRGARAVLERQRGSLFDSCRRSVAQCPNEKTTQARTSKQFDEDIDILIVGSGAAGLTAALRCNALSLKSIVIEKTEKLGGTSAISGGGMWIPNNPFLRGYKDSVEKALTYMNSCIGNVGPASTPQRRMAFLENAPQMINFLRDVGFVARASGEYPNYYPDLPGGDIPRSVESVVFDAKKLGAWHAKVRQLATPYPPVYTDESSRLFRAATSLSNMVYAARTLGLRSLRTLIGQHPVTMGPALVCQLLHLNLQRKTNFWMQSELIDLITENEKVVGAMVKRNGKTVRVRAGRGVLLVAGGFARNAKMRQEYQESPVGAQWTSAQPQDTGDAIRIAKNLDAQLELLDDAWWGPTAIDPSSGQRFFLIYERALPHCIIVDSSGKRFMNESQSYTDAVHAMYARNRKIPSIPSWLILDSNHRRKYPLANMLPGRTPAAAVDSGFLRKADTLEDLARQIGAESDLSQPVERFNEMAYKGRDEDFGRGENQYDRFFGDDNVRPNGSLGPLVKAPFYALKVWPGDLGTKGGLLTDEEARVMSSSGVPIEGLFAAGNSSASVMGRSYPGPGATLAPALTFSYIAVNHMARGAHVQEYAEKTA